MTSGGAERWDRIATSYDKSLVPSLRHYQRVRERALRGLRLRRGDMVVEMGCGPGTCLPQLSDAVGPTGVVIGVDFSRAMLDIARRATVPYANVRLIQDDASTVALPAPANAVLFMFVHDIIRCETAVENVVAQVDAGARIAAAGAKQPRGILAPFGNLIALRFRTFTRSDSLDRPWLNLSTHLKEVHVDEFLCGFTYVMTGIVDPSS